MRWDKYNLNYADDTNKRMNTNQKSIPSRFLYSDIFWGFEVSPGDRPAEPIIAHKYAPTVREITTQSYFKKNIIIPTGTIISAAPIMASETYTAVGDVGGMGAASGEVGSGEIALGIGYDSTVLLTDINDGFEGYDRLRIVAQIANNGVLTKDVYKQADVDLGRVDDGGALVTTNKYHIRPANIPIGFVTEDIYIFDEGGKLNYAQGVWEKFSSFATDYFVEMPYVVSDHDGADEYKMACAVNGVTGVQTQAVGYAAAVALGMPFLRGELLTDLYLGGWVCPDPNGKYQMQYESTNALTGSKTAQTVGKLISFTNKFPMDLEGLVETYHTTKTGGTATYGIEYRLYVMINAVLTAVNGSAPSYTQIKDAINSGKFGIARLNLHTS